MSVKDDGTANIRAAEAGEIMERFDFQAIVIFGVRKDGVVDLATYGSDQRKCDSIAEWGKGVLQHSVTVAPFQTMFGWGNGGIPLRMDEKSLEELSERGREFVARNTHPNAVRQATQKVPKHEQ